MDVFFSVLRGERVSALRKLLTVLAPTPRARTSALVTETSRRSMGNASQRVKEYTHTNKLYTYTVLG